MPIAVGDAVPRRKGRRGPWALLALAALLVVGLAIVVPASSGAAAQVQSPTDELTTASVSLDTEEQAALAAMNGARAARGLAPLALSVALGEAADWMGRDMIAQGLLTHTDSLGRGLRERLTAFGHPTNTFISENVARGGIYDSGDAVTIAFLESPAHRANILSADVSAVGIARVADTSGSWRWYWVVDFGSVPDETPLAPAPTVPAPTEPAPVAPTPSALTRMVVLTPGWNLVGWSGPARAAWEALRDITANVEIVIAWDALSQRFRSFSPAVPPDLNTLNTINGGDGLWIKVRGSALLVWEQPTSADIAAPTLRAGFNLVSWGGADGTETGLAIAPLSDAFRGLFTWDAARQRFRSYLSGVPSSQQTATLLAAGAGVWIEVVQTTTWDPAGG